MEHMGGNPRSKHAKSSGSGQENTNNTPTDVVNASSETENTTDDAANTANVGQKAPQSIVREQDQYMPIANVIRIMRRILPPHAKISDDAKETVQECVSEYIAFITGEANERCQREQRKTVTAEDVLWAMGKLGFDNYIQPLSLFLQKYRESESSDRSSLRGDFMKRDHEMVGPAVPQVAMMPPPPPPYGVGFPFGPQHGHGMIDPSMVGLFRDRSSSDASGAGGSSSSSGAKAPNSMGGFDPFAPYK